MAKCSRRQDSLRLDYIWCNDRVGYDSSLCSSTMSGTSLNSAGDDSSSGFQLVDDVKFQLEDTELYSLMCRGSRAALRRAWVIIGTLPDEEILRRSETDNSTYLHHIVDQAPKVYDKYKDIDILIPLIYRLALRGVNVSAQNAHGNTCLHLACLRPHAEPLYSHLIRIGVDPCIQNNKGCRIIHTYHNHLCHMVKGQANARSGIWNAVEQEDVVLLEKLLRTWCRVCVQRNKSLRDLADETSNVSLIRLLDRHEATNELVTAAFACDTELMSNLLRRSRAIQRRSHVQHGSMVQQRREFRTCLHPASPELTSGRSSARENNFPIVYGEIDLNQADESCDVPKPMLVALRELSPLTDAVIKMLEIAGAEGSLEEYTAQVAEFRSSFESSELFVLLDEGTDESLTQALEIILNGTFDPALRGSQLEEAEEQHDGWTYLHLVTDRYVKMTTAGEEERARLLIRAIYRLALSGVDVNARDAEGRTALGVAAAASAAVRDGEIDQKLITHLLRIGIDTSLTDSRGRTVSEEVYKDRGKLIYGRQYRLEELPGLWVSVCNNDVRKTERWLRTWARVTVVRNERRLIDVARSLDNQQIVKLLEAYEHINEFVCATFACDLKRMMNAIALGGGVKKVNTIDEFFHVGFTVDRHAEFIRRPIIISALELCTAQVVDFLLSFGADLSKFYDESQPCGPTAFWSLRDHVTNDNALVVARHADVTLRNEDGMTMLHAIVRKRRHPLKRDVIETLLNRGIDVASRDYEGSTARDYITIYNVENGDEIRQMIDSHVLDFVGNDQLYRLETLVIDSYDHILDVRGTKRNKMAAEIAQVKHYSHFTRFFQEMDKYKADMESLQAAAKYGNVGLASRNSGEKRCAWARDKAGRTLLHTAVLYEQPDVVRFLVEQYPHLINSRDNLSRTPLHLCVCLRNRQLIWPILQEAGADPRILDANNMSVYDYVRELDSPTSLKRKSKAKRLRNFSPAGLIEHERNAVYGLRANSHTMNEQLMKLLSSTGSHCTVDITEDLANKYKPVDLSVDDLDIPLLMRCMELKLEDVTIELLKNEHCRVDVQLPISGAQDGAPTSTTVHELAEQLELQELLTYLKSLEPTPECDEIETGLTSTDDSTEQKPEKSWSHHSSVRPSVAQMTRLTEEDENQGDATSSRDDLAIGATSVDVVDVQSEHRKSRE